MVFSSVTFLFLFLPLTILLYFLVPRRFRKTRNLVLLIFSLGFYFYGEPKYILLMLLSILINYLAGIILTSLKGKKSRKSTLFISVFLNLALLSYYKYFTFFNKTLVEALSLDAKVIEILLPIGISFYTFQGLSYVVDVYRNDAPVQKNPLNIALYISLFPQLIAGPIVRYQTVAEELTERRESLSDFSLGARRFIFGLGKKMILANSMGLIADEVFALNIKYLSPDYAWLGAIAYEFQIFFDFSGYSDMAIGLGLMFGFHFLENFNFPLISKSVTEFWRRWHMSLGTWFRDYVYIPLGGNRVKPIRHIFNILVVWALTGFWHGANWTFMAWGVYFAIFLILEKLFLLKVLSKIPKFISHIYALLVATISWVIFRSESISEAFLYIEKMFSFTGASNVRTLYLLREYCVEIIICIIASIPISRFLSEKVSKIKNEPLRDFLLHYPVGVFALIVFLISILYLINSTFNPFIYFRF